MKTIVTFIISLFCFGLSAQELLIIDQNTNKEYRKDLSNIVDTSLTKKIPDLKSNLKVYKVVREVSPSYNRLTETIDQKRNLIESIPDGEVYPVCVYSWGIVNLDDETIRTRKKIAVKRKEMEVLLNEIPDDKFKQFIIIVAGMYAYEHAGNQLNTTMEDVLQNKIMPPAIEVWKNYQATQKLLNDLDLDHNTNIDEFLNK